MSAMTSQYQSAAHAEGKPQLASLRKGEGMPLVLLHGGVGSRTHWFRNIDRLAKHFHVVAIDLPGFGASPDVPKNIEPAEYVDWVIEAVAEIAHGEKFALAGSLAVHCGEAAARIEAGWPGFCWRPAASAFRTDGRSGVRCRQIRHQSRRRTAVAANLGN